MGPRLFQGNLGEGEIIYFGQDYETVVVSTMFYFHPDPWRSDPIWSICHFKMGWNHHLDQYCIYHIRVCFPGHTVIFFSDLGKTSTLIWCFDCKGTIVNCLDFWILFRWIDRIDLYPLLQQLPCPSSVLIFFPKSLFNFWFFPWKPSQPAMFF